jgi:hypothetical protein
MQEIAWKDRCADLDEATHECLVEVPGKPKGLHYFSTSLRPVSTSKGPSPK